jgi:hypothetical protein
MTPTCKFTRPKEESLVGGESRRIVEHAKSAIEEMAVDAIYAQRSGTIGVEISFKDGVLGKVKRTQIEFR